LKQTTSLKSNLFLFYKSVHPLSIKNQERFPFPLLFLVCNFQWNFNEYFNCVEQHRVLVLSSVLGVLIAPHLASLMSHKLCFVSPDHWMSTHYDSWVGSWCQTARNLHELCVGYTLRCIRMTRFGPKLGQTDPKWDKLVTYSEQISVYFHSLRSKKVPDLSHKVASLTHFVSKSDISDVYSSLYPCQCRGNTLHYYHHYYQSAHRITYFSWSRGGEIMRVPL